MHAICAEPVAAQELDVASSAAEYAWHEAAVRFGLLKTNEGA